MDPKLIYEFLTLVSKYYPVRAEMWADTVMDRYFAWSRPWHDEKLRGSMVVGAIQFNSVQFLDNLRGRRPIVITPPSLVVHPISRRLPRIDARSEQQGPYPQI